MLLLIPTTDYNMEQTNPGKPISLTILHKCNRLKFDSFTLADIKPTAALVPLSGSRACDFTVGGIYLWIDYCRYTRCFLGDTMFIKRGNENDVMHTSFSLPIGIMPIQESVDLLHRYCKGIGIPLRFSGVPADRLDELTSLGAKSVTRLDNWADYIYDANSLAYLSGRKYNKKRNHVNRFISDNPGWKLENITAAHIPAIKAFIAGLPKNPHKPPIADYEHAQAIKTLDNLNDFATFSGAVLTSPSVGIAAVTIGETVGDTLHIHIEKIDHRISGAGEAINTLFARMMTSRNSRIAWINRQDDAGDPGLRQAKKSWHPTTLLHKYNVIF